MINFDPMIFRIADFWEWDNRKELILSPKYQRRRVWSEKAKSYLIDTILRGLPLPKVFMKYSVDIETKKSFREIVDGQQRIATILSYLNDGFKVMRVHNKEYGGKYFSELDEKQKRSFWEFKISVDVLSLDDDTYILDIFARLNTYTATLKKQELLNSKYFGAFKQAVYSLGFRFKDFWVNNNILSERQIARMAEAEFTSELVIQLIDGINDRKSIESFYKKYDDDFPNEQKVKRLFVNNIDAIANIIGSELSETNFSSTHLFYTLFGVINELRSKKKLREKIFPRIKNALIEIDNILDTQPEELNSKYFSFYDASTKHVTDLKIRKIRHSFILNFIKQKAQIK